MDDPGAPQQMLMINLSVFNRGIRRRNRPRHRLKSEHSSAIYANKNLKRGVRERHSPAGMLPEGMLFVKILYCG
jgi:hypothetical protein